MHLKDSIEQTRTLHQDKLRILEIKLVPKTLHCSSFLTNAEINYSGFQGFHAHFFFFFPSSSTKVAK